MEYRVFPMDGQTWRIEEYDGSTSVYMYLLAGSKRAILIDTGMGIINVAQVVRGLTGLPVEVLNTHGHFDHIGGNSLFDVAYMHRAEEPVYRLHSSDAVRGGFPYRFRPARDNIRWIGDGEKFDLGGRTLQVIWTPGHSLGSVCVLDVERRQCFTGDTCCKADVLLMMEYCTTVAEYAETIRHLQSLRSEFDVTWPGHHTAPVPPNILDQFEEAAALLCRGEAEGVLYETPVGSCLRFPYQDIAIDYEADRIH